MPSVSSEVYSLLACPKCHGAVTLTSDGKGVSCGVCRLAYPIRGGVPVMLMEEALPLRGNTAAESSFPSSSGEQANFSVVEGKNKGIKIELEKGTCRALGRSLDDTERTQIFSLDSNVSLDETSKKIVMQYLAKQFNKSGAAIQKSEGKELLGGFYRVSDFPIRDTAVSRLHAMIFFDDSGQVGVLDLVSKNGTYVNGAEVESKILKKGDLITIGGTKIRFES